ncbi:hypothetical protein [Limnohabitans sp. 15K]|nr:hypothetical protein [Limnohabitans sp. 15K]
MTAPCSLAGTLCSVFSNGGKSTGFCAQAVAVVLSMLAITH